MPLDNRRINHLPGCNDAFDFYAQQKWRAKGLIMHESPVIWLRQNRQRRFECKPRTSQRQLFSHPRIRNIRKLRLFITTADIAVATDKPALFNAAARIPRGVIKVAAKFIECQGLKAFLNQWVQRYIGKPKKIDPAILLCVNR